MRRKSMLLIIAVMIISANSFAQKIFMKVPTATGKSGEEVIALNVSLEAESSWTKGGGASVGKPNPGKLAIRKTNGPSTAEFLKNIASGKSFPEIVFEYVDNSGKASYIISLSGVYITELSWVTPDCSNCPKLQMQVEMIYKTYQIFDAATGTTVKWDIPMGKVE